MSGLDRSRVLGGEFEVAPELPSLGRAQHGDHGVPGLCLDLGLQPPVQTHRAHYLPGFHHRQLGKVVEPPAQQPGGFPVAEFLAGCAHDHRDQAHALPLGRAHQAGAGALGVPGLETIHALEPAQEFVGVVEHEPVLAERFVPHR